MAGILFGASRRTFLGVSAAAIVSAGFPNLTRAALAASVDSLQTISQVPQHYHGWPTLAQRKSGELLVVCSGGREGHVCPFGRVELVRSHDGGRSWSWPEVVLDGPIDDRDAGVIETARGSLLITTFTSLAYEPELQKAEGTDGEKSSGWPADKLRRWQAAHRRVNAEQRKAALGVWMIRSSDGGVTWSRRFDCLVNSPHGPMQLADGRLLYAGKDLWREPNRVGVCESSDDGVTWHWLAEIPTREGDDHREYHELHGVETTDGRIVVHIRNHNQQHRGETLQTESADGGKTWAQPRSIGVWGLPSHLLKLRDGRLVMSYGFRRPPFGNQVRVSEDQARSWSDPVTISGDGASGDLGYPSTAQLPDGSLVTVWYEQMKGSPFAQLRLAKWRLT